MGLTKFPNELLLHIAKDLGAADLGCFIQTGRLFRDTLTPLLYDMAIKDHNRSSAIHWATKRGHCELLKLIIKNGVDINALQDTLTPLMMAAECNNMTTVRILLDNGASMEIVNAAGQTALGVGLRKGAVGVCRLLLHRGANPNIPVRNKNDGSITSPLFMAIRYNVLNRPLIELLLDKGARMDDRYGHKLSTVLYAATIRDHYPQTVPKEVVALLLELGADPNVQNFDGNTALHAVLGERYTDQDIVSLLLEGGVNLDIQNRYGNTVLHEAVLGRVPTETIQLLLKYGADPYIENMNGKTAFELSLDSYGESSYYYGRYSPKCPGQLRHEEPRRKEIARIFTPYMEINNGEYVRGEYVQYGYAQDGYAQDGYIRYGYVQGGYVQGEYAQGGYAQGGYAQGGYVRGGYIRDECVRGECLQCVSSIRDESVQDESVQDESVQDESVQGEPVQGTGG